MLEQKTEVISRLFYTEGTAEPLFASRSHFEFKLGQQLASGVMNCMGGCWLEEDHAILA